METLPFSPRLAEIVQEIMDEPGPATLAQKLVGYIKELTQSDEAAVYIATRGQPQTYVLGDYNPAVESLPGPRQAMQSGLTGQAYQQNKTIFLAARPPQSGAQIAVPIRSNRATLGVAAAQRWPGKPDYAQGEIDLAAFLAFQTGEALEQIRMAAAEEQRQQAGQFFVQAGRKLSAGLEPRLLPGRILEELALIVPYERGSLLLREKDVVRIAAQRGFPPDERTQRLTIQLSPGDVFFQIAESGQPLLIDDVTKSSGWKQVEWLALNRSWLGLPLFSKNQVFGMVSLTRVESGAFSREDVITATTFAMQASVALENANLYEELSRFNQQLEEIVAQRTQELRTALDALARMDKNKSDFINVAAHELRTPLTVMKGYLSMLHTNPTIQGAPFLVQAVDGVLKGTDRLHEVVNSMLDLARIDNQVLEIKPEMMAISTVIHRVQADYAGYLAERQQTLEIINVDGLPMLPGDGMLLLKVFQNVIINAIKYTPDGGQIAVKGRTVTDPALGNCVEIIVQDTGIGIDKEQQEMIFEKLYSTTKVALHSSGKASFKGGGPGLGLTIARGIIQAHGGRIWVVSHHHDEIVCPGSAFHILLPIKPPK